MFTSNSVREFTTKIRPSGNWKPVYFALTYSERTVAQFRLRFMFWTSSEQHGMTLFTPPVFFVMPKMTRRTHCEQYAIFKCTHPQVAISGWSIFHYFLASPPSLTLLLRWLLACLLLTMCSLLTSFVSWIRTAVSFIPLFLRFFFSWTVWQSVVLTLPFSL